MSKMTRLVGGELNKMFQKPLIFVVISLLVLSLFVTFYLFPAQNKYDNLSYYDKGEETTIDSIVYQFNTTSEQYGKTKTDQVLNNVKNKVAFYDRVAENDDSIKTIKTLQTYFASIKNLYTQSIKNIISEGESSFNSTKASTCANSVNSILLYLSEFNYDYQFITNMDSTTALVSKETASTLDEIIEQGLKYLSTDEYGNIYTYSSSTSYSTFAHLVSSLDNNTVIGKIESLLNKFIDVSSKVTSNDLAKITEILNKTLTFEEALDQKIQSAEEGAIEKEEVISNCLRYYLIADQLKSYVDNSFYKLIFNKISESDINKMLNFENTYFYNINEQILLNEYLLAQNPIISGIDYNASYSSQSSSNSVTVFDFMYYGLSVLVIGIILAAILYGTGMIATERQNSTIQNLATRPFKRNKIISAKIWATIILSVMLLLLFTLLFFVVGLILFGANFSPIIFVFNASSVITMSPILYVLIFLLLSILKITAFILLSVAISTFFKTYKTALVVTIVCCFAIISLNALSLGVSFVNFLLPANLDLIKYFGSSIQDLYVVSTPILHNTNLISSSIFTLVIIALLSVVAHISFNKQEIK